MWRNPLIIAGKGETATVVFSGDRVENADLFILLGEPSTPVNWDITFDGIDVLGFRIENTFPSGTTFQINVINGARIIGFGGIGGNGGDVTVSSQGNGQKGWDGGAAIQSDFDISIDLDTGFLLGGGGGGGGGAGYHIPSSTNRQAGSGGGGGAGFCVSIDSPFFPGGFFCHPGGIAGTGHSGVPAAENGNFSTIDPFPGDGGAANTAGGDGGELGSAGEAGTSLDPFDIQFFEATGGTGGNAGAAFRGLGGSTMTLTGAKSEATLRSEGRIKGQSKAPYFMGQKSTTDGASGTANRFTNDDSDAASTTHGFTFTSDGRLQYLNSAGNPFVTNYLFDTVATGQTIVGADFEIRQVSGPGVTLTGTWDSEASAVGTWIDLSANRSYSFTHGAGVRFCGRLFEFRRADVPGNPDNEILGRLWLMAVDEGGV